MPHMRQRMWEKRKVVRPTAGYRHSTSLMIRSPPPSPTPWPEERATLSKILLGLPYRRKGRGVLQPWRCSSYQEAAILALQVGYIALPFEVDP